MKYIFLFFAAFEFFAGSLMITATPEKLDQTFPGLNIGSEPMHFIFGFGSAISALALISVFGAFIKDRLALIALTTGFLFYNAMAAYNSFFASVAPEVLINGAYAHSVFVTAFLIVLYRLIFIKKED